MGCMGLAIKGAEVCIHSLTPRRTAPSVLPAVSMSLPCPDCEQTFKNPSARSHHRWSRHSKLAPITVGGKEYVVEREGDNLYCPVDQCGRSFPRREGLTKHVQAAHGTTSESSMPSPSPMGSSQYSIRSQQLSFTPTGSESRVVLLDSLNIYSFTHRPESKMTEASGGDSGGEALLPMAPSVTSDGMPQVLPDLLEDGETNLRVS